MDKFKNPNSLINRINKSLRERWSTPDTPQTETRFQINLFLKDVLLFIGIPIATVVLFKILEKSFSANSPSPRANLSRLNKDFKSEPSKTQIVEFVKSKNSLGLESKKPPGTLVKVKLLNVVETFGTVPVHVQVLDESLGSQWMGSTLIGEATAVDDIQKINITFNLAKSYLTPNLARSIKGRALELNGTFGLDAEKKEGFFARASLRSTESGNASDSSSQENDTKVSLLLIRALAGGFLREGAQNAKIAEKRSQVLTLKPGSVFFVELTDYFPGDKK